MMKTILVIEDTSSMLENITEILQLAPYEVIPAVNGKEGLERARQVCPDLILCDIRMPELDGYGVLHILRKDPALVNIPFVFLTAKAEAADFRAGMDLGADDYLIKPFDDLTLLGVVALRLKKDADTLIAPGNSARLDNLTRAILAGTDAIQSLCAFYPTTTYNRKHCLFTAGSWPTALYFICRGKGKLYKEDMSGNEYITSLAGPGDFVGYLALLEETTYTETAELLEESAICLVPRSDFMALIYSHPAVAEQVMRLLAGDVAALQERLLKLAYQSVRKRVAEALLLVEQKFYPPPAESTWSGSPPFERPTPNTSPAMTLSRENWSHLVGASIETVIRVLGDLRNEGLIALNGSQITLLDINKLTLLKR